MGNLDSVLDEIEDVVIGLKNKTVLSESEAASYRAKLSALADEVETTT